MTTQATAFINPNIVKWARERAQASPRKVAKALGVKVEKIVAWEEGRSRPTLSQAQRLAEKLRVPFGYFYLDTPPKEKLPIPDFRTVGSKEHSASHEFINLLNDVVFKHQWYRELLLDEGRAPLPFVGRFKADGKIDHVASDIRSTLKLTPGVRQQCSGWQEFLAEFRRLVEEVGILVMRSGVVANNPYRPVTVQEFRGFTMSDDIAPLIFINATDSRAAQIFTLAHELAHVWTGTSGISNQALKGSDPGTKNLELFCNAVAAETIIPRDEFIGDWNRFESTEQNIKALSRGYKVSTLVTLRRALDTGRIGKQEYDALYKREEQKHKDQEEKGSGGDYYATIISRNGRPLTVAAIQGVLERRVLYRDAARVLNVSVPVVSKLTKRLMEGGI